MFLREEERSVNIQSIRVKFCAFFKTFFILLSTKRNEPSGVLAAAADPSF